MIRLEKVLHIIFDYFKQEHYTYIIHIFCDHYAQ
jgi:hypothetical protein